MSQSACSQWNNGHSDAGQIVFCHETSAELLIETRCVRLHRASPTTECDRVHFSCTCSALPTGKQHLNEPSSLQWLTDRSGMENRERWRPLMCFCFEQVSFEVMSPAVPCTNPSLCARPSPAIHSVHKLKPYLLFPPSDALTVTLVIHSVLILYYYANNIIISTVNWKWSLFQQQTVQQWQQIWQRGIRGNIWHGCLLFWMPEGCALAARSQMFILAGSTEATCVTDQLLWIVKFWCHYLSDENKRVEPQRRHSAALRERADPLFFWSPQFEDSIFVVGALIWSVFGAFCIALL